MSSSPPSAFAHIGNIASQRAVHAALGWLHLHEQQIMRWQMECVAIPAPPFNEGPRGQWLLERFIELGLADVACDKAGNILASLDADVDERLPVILITAHIDTVFPEGTRIEPTLRETRLEAPGACDNGAGIAALLAIATSLRHAALRPARRIVFVANTGEEGEGDLQGMRHLYRTAPWPIAAHIVLDGAGHNVAVVAALGSRRFEVEITGPGGHSWSDAGRPHPVLALADALARLRAAHPPLSLPRVAGESRSTWNVGTIEGGSGVNSIPSSATARFDLRSTSPDDLLRLEVALHRAVEDAVMDASFGANAENVLEHSIRPIGDRPAGAIREDARLLALLRSVDRHLGLRTELRTASTDANIPLSLGVEAIALGAGGEGGGTHTTSEWYDARGRDLGLRRILLLLLAAAEDTNDLEDEILG